MFTASQLAILNGPNPMAAVHSWLRQFIPIEIEGSTNVYTHLDLSGNGGGKFCLPSDREAEFLALLGTAFERCEQLDNEQMQRTQERHANLDECRQALEETGSLPSLEGLRDYLVRDIEAVAKNGSTLAAIEEQRLAVANELAASLDHNYNTTAFFVEKRTEVFMYFVDFDMSEPTPQVDVAKVLSYMRVVQSVLQRFYSRQFSLVICSVARCKIVHTDQGEQRYKHGYHIYATDLWLTAIQALTIRELLLSELQLQFGARETNDWTQVVDASVYDGAGLRMTYCSKAIQCEKCKSKKARTQHCDNCRGRRKLFERWRRYTPWRCLDEQGNLEPERLAKLRDKTFTLQTLSIRAKPEQLATPGYVRPPEAPEYFPALKGLKANASADSDDEKQSDHFANDTNCMSKIRNRKLLSLSSEVRLALQRQLRQFDLPYAHLILHRVYLVDNPNPYLICHVRGQGSQFCKNKGADHKGNTIWFHISSSGIRQKCFCRCPTEVGRVAGLCKNYHSNVVPLPPSLAAQLLPERPNKKRPVKGPVNSLYSSSDGDPLALLRKKLKQ